jgi:hypothetical protein
MTQMVQSLFGINPEQLQAHRDQALWQQAQQFANLNPMERASAGAFMAGRQMVNGAAGLMGAQDPELQRIAMRQNLAKSIDWSNPEALKKAAQQAMQNGDYAAAKELMATADDVEKTALDKGVKQSTIVKNLREKQSLSVEEQVFKALAVKASPASVKAAIEAGGDISMLDVPIEEKLSAMGRQLLEAGFKPGTKEFTDKMRAIVDAEIKGKEKGSGNVTVNMPGAGIDPKKASEEAGKETGKAIAGVEEKYSAIDSIREAQTMLDQGIFSGFWGKTKMNVRKAFGENDPKVVNTEKYMAYIGEVVIPRLKDFGGNDSNEEMKYLQKVLAGEQSLEANTMKDVLATAERKIQRGIERLQRQSKAAATGQPAPLDAGPSRQAPAGTKENPIKLK